MKTFILFILLLPFPFSNSTLIKTYKYRVDIEIKKGISERKKAYLLQKYGDTMLFTVNNEGDFRMEYPNSGKYGVKYYQYSKESLNCYYLSKVADTLYYYSAKENFIDLIDTQESKLESGEKVISYYSHVKNNPDVIFHQTYIFDPKQYKLSGSNFEEYKDCFWGDYFTTSNSMFKKKAIETSEMILTYTLIEELNSEENNADFFDLESFPRILN